nr:ceramide kinase [Bactrocera oleae]XP_036229324.1 ceramide kinase [Bactrocera oleae]XP_036229325.1 ceramide kinase [Bactrocera oleae]XP_036229326.1 ceramide kinase [Bactrocera oleae]XP_036229327.1 ceramide kinase [Bactrocera oleae]XP_036229328.1 ceramide kinase [Bactrocera oleae]XP_036229329.1 ceramide kinase [Bactrocera oleae]
MTQSSTDFAQLSATHNNANTASRKEKEATPAARAVSPIASSQNCDILLSNFQIKKKRYRVLLNYDHIVWEQLQSKRNSDADAECNLKQSAVYGKNTNVLHINELIRVSKGNTKSAALHIAAPQPMAEFDAHTASEQQQQHSSTPPTEQYLALSYAARIVNSETDCNRWDVHNLVLYNADAYVVRQWHALLNKMLANTAPTRLRVRRLLVFINPYGGRQRGLHVYERHCKPLFQLAGIDASCIISQRSNQIRDILLSHDLSPFDAVCCVGGDGTVAEVINGLIFRAICDAGLDARQPPYVPRPTLPVAIIPAGSTDTVAYSLHGTADVRTAAIHLILGQRRGLDICSVRNREGVIRFCASVLSYGYLGDVAARSERYRWLGTKRYEFAGVKTFLTNNGYEAELRVFQPIGDKKLNAIAAAHEEGARSENVSTTDDTICYTNCTRCDAASIAQAALATKCALMQEGVLASATAPTRVEGDELPTSSNASLKSCDDSNDGQSNTTNYLEVGGTAAKLRGGNMCDASSSNETMDFDDKKHINLTDCDNNSEMVCDAADGECAPEIKSKVESEWKTINGKFFMISGANITCACTRSPNGVARYSHLGDGYLDLILVRKTSLLNNVRLLINLMGRSGDIRNLPFVETYRTKKFCFRSPNANLAQDYSISGSCQPIAETVDYDDDNGLSRWNCDGEVVNDQELTMISHCQLIDVFMRGPHTYNKPLKSAGKSLLCCCCGCCRIDE